MHSFRFICKILLSWLVSVVYSFAPIAVNKTGHYLYYSFVCVLNWHDLEPYYSTITCVIIVPCFLGTLYNFFRIMHLQFSYRSHPGETKLTEADVEYLIDPNHKMSIGLVIFFWLSCVPYVVYIIESYLNSSSDEPAFITYWSGRCHVVYRLPILIICFSRYRSYFKSCRRKQSPATPAIYKKLWNPSNPFRCEEQTIYI